jgi:hypothetical protein
MFEVSPSSLFDPLFLVRKESLLEIFSEQAKACSFIEEIKLFVVFIWDSYLYHL